jgi:hypothetical protein
MIRFFKWVKNNPNRAMFLVPILLVAGISISHVVTWYDIANPISWAIYLSIAIEVAAITALIAATNKVKGGVWFMFGLVTFIQMLGNIFYSYKEIDASGELFISWIELTGPVWEMFGSDISDIPTMKRYLAFLEGGLLPVISLTSLHFFVKYQKEEEEEVEATSEEDVHNSADDESKESFEKVVEEKKKKLEEDKRVFEPLLRSLYSVDDDEGAQIQSGEILPTYVEFREKVDSKFTDDNIKMFLTLCNYLHITELSDNVRKSKADYNSALIILSKYLTLEVVADDELENSEKPNNKISKNKDWWSTSKSKKNKL